MKIIHTIYNHADFQSSIIEFDGLWAEFTNMINTALERDELIEDMNSIYSRTPLDFGILLPTFKTHMILKMDEHHLMIYGIKQDGIPLINMFYVLEE